MSALSRRSFTESTLASLLGYAFLETVFRGEAFSAEMRLVARKWLADLNAMGQDLKDRKLKATEWQTKVEELFTSVDVADFLRFIDFEKLTANLKYPASGEKSLRATWPKVEDCRPISSSATRYLRWAKDVVWCRTDTTTWLRRS